MTLRQLAPALAIVALAACGAATEPSAAQSTSERRTESAAYAAAAAKRGPEDPKLVWTPAAVALMSRELAPGVFAVFPDDAERKSAEGIPVATSGGFVVGSNGVLLIDTMINRNLANQLLALVAERSAAPVQYAVNTSYHGDHSYGNQFLPEATQVIQHANTQNYVQTKFADDIAFMSQFFGSSSGLDELTPQRAEILFRDGETRDIDLGGKIVRVMHLGFAQSQGDLFVYVPSDKVLFTGNPILSGGPSFSWLLDGHAADATATLKRIRAEFPADTVIVPGHGVPTDMSAVDRHIAYLEELQREVASAKAAGLTAAQASARVGERMQAKWGTYKIYPFIHTELNVSKTFAEAGAQ